MIINIELTDKEERIARNYAKLEGVDVAYAFKNALFNEIEEKYEALLGDKHIEEHETNPDVMDFVDFLKRLELE